MEQQKRGLFPYDDILYMLADMLDDNPNRNTHANGHSDLITEINLVAEY